MHLFESLFGHVSRGNVLRQSGGLGRPVGVACFLLLLATGPNALAQGIQGGLRIGPTFGYMNDNPVPFNRDVQPFGSNANVRLGLHVGAFVIVPIAEHLALQPEVMFVQKGGHLSRFNHNRYTSERYQFTYLQGQLLGRRTVSLPGPLSLHAVAGLTIDRALGGVIQRDIQTKLAHVEERVQLLENRLIQRWDVGGLLGAGVEYPVGTASHFALNVRYNPGFRTIFTESERPAAEKLVGVEDPPPLTRDPPALRHDVISVSLSYTASLGR